MLSSHNILKDVFTWDDQVRTAEWLSKHPGSVVLSNQATENIVTLYKRLGFDLFFLDAPRRISCTGDRTPVKEVLALKREQKRSKQVTVLEGSKMNIKEWLLQNNYDDVLKKINTVEKRWGKKATKTRRNWGDVLAGHKDGSSKTIEGVEFPVLCAARKRKSWPVTDTCLCRNSNEKMPSAVPQIRWEKCKTHSHEKKENND